jgi:hypothetical protein
LQDPPKFTQLGIFGFENMTSGNPAAQTGTFFWTDSKFNYLLGLFRPGKRGKRKCGKTQMRKNGYAEKRGTENADAVSKIYAPHYFSAYQPICEGRLFLALKSKNSENLF